MSKHTPGPWTLTARSGADVLIGAFEIRGMFGDKSNVYPIFQQSRSAIDGAEIYLHPADAILIAAAPELLAALKGFIQGRPCPIVTHHRDDCGWCAAIRAIAKAEGGEQ